MGPNHLVRKSEYAAALAINAGQREQAGRQPHELHRAAGIYTGDPCFTPWICGLRRLQLRCVQCGLCGNGRLPHNVRADSSIACRSHHTVKQHHVAGLRGPCLRASMRFPRRPRVRAKLALPLFHGAPSRPTRPAPCVKPTSISPPCCRQASCPHQGDRGELEQAARLGHDATALPGNFRSRHVSQAARRAPRLPANEPIFR
jgi:hypothetical protein